MWLTFTETIVVFMLLPFFTFGRFTFAFESFLCISIEFFAYTISKHVALISLAAVGFV